jgi:hypothetical protein
MARVDLFFASAFRSAITNEALAESLHDKFAQSIGALDMAGRCSSCVFASLFAEKGEGPTIADMLAEGTGEPLAKVMSLLMSGERLAEVREIDFGSKFAATGVAVLNLVRVMQTPEMVQFAIELCERRPRVFAGILVLDGALGNELMMAVSSSTLAAVLAETAGVDGRKVYNIPQLMLPMLFPEMEPVRMTGNQLGFMLRSLSG